MSNILSLQQRAINSIALGESHFREFKTALEGAPGKKRPRKARDICGEIGEALVAFANADGGELFIGVEDDGDVTGLQHSDADIAMMRNAYKTHILDSDGLPLQISNLVTIDGKRILFFSVTKSTHKIFQLPDGRCMRRQDKSTMPESIEKIQFDRKELASREYDRLFVDGATVNDLDLHLVQQVADVIFRGMSPEQYLQQMNLAEYGMGGLRIKQAALLLFAKDISKWCPRCQVRILKVDGDELLTGEQYNVINDEFITGNILSLLANAWERLRPYLTQKTVFDADARFEQTFSYPENACREALVNAIAHRDYSISNPVTVYIYSSRLVFESPGELLSTINIKDLRQGVGTHESRNSNIARVLRENKYMRELGEGIRRIFDLFKSQELAAPVIESKNSHFQISMSHKSIYTENELMWLSLFDAYDLDQYQKRIIIAGINGKALSPALIYSALGSGDRNLYDRSVTTLRIKNILTEINTSENASRLARASGKQKQEISRYKVVVPKAPSQPVPNKIYIYDLSKDITEASLRAALSIFGEIVEVKIPVDEHTGSMRGFAFITFSTSESALKAVAIKNIKVGETVATIIPYRPYRNTRGKGKKRNSVKLSKK